LGLGLVATLMSLRTVVTLREFFLRPGDNVFPESCILQAVKWAADGEKVYRPLDDVPVAPMLYGPLTYYIPAWMARASGDVSIYRLRLVGRSWSLACYVLVGLLVAEIAVTLRRRRGVWTPDLPDDARSPVDWRECLLLGSAAAACFWIFTPIPQVAVTVRCDLQFMLLNLLTVRLLMCYDGRERLPFMALVALAVGILLSASVRQIVLGPPATILLWLMARRQWRQALGFGFGVPLAALVLLGAGEWLNGGAVIDNLLKSGKVAYNLYIMRDNFEHIQSYLLVLFVPGLVLSVAAWQGELPQAMSLYAVAALPFAVLLSGKKGSSQAYFMETLMASAPAAVLAFRLVIRQAVAWWPHGATATAPPLAVAIVAMLCVGGVQHGALATNNLLGILREPQPTADFHREVERRLAEYGEDIVAVDLTLPVLRLGIPWLTADPFQHELIASSKQISWVPLIDAIETCPARHMVISQSMLGNADYAPATSALHRRYRRDDAASQGMDGWWIFTRIEETPGASAP